MNSIGFRAKGTPNKAGGMHFTSIDIFEASVVAVGAHPDAVMLAKHYNIELPAESVKVLGGDKAASGSLPPPKKTGVKTMNLAERIQAQQKSIVSITDDLESIETQLDNDQGNADLMSSHREKAAQLKSAVDYLNALKDRETAAAMSADAGDLHKKAAPASALSPTGRFLPPDTQANLKGGDLMAKKAAMHFLAHTKGVRVQEIAETVYRGDKLADMIAKAAAGVGDTTTAGTYAELTRNDTKGLIEAMQSTSVAAALAMKGISASFGINKTITYPYEVGDYTGAAWTGEAGHVPVVKAPVGNRQFDRNKLTALVAYTEELRKMSVIDLEAYLRRALLAKFAYKLDTTLMSAAAGLPGVKPAGLLAGVVGITPTTGGGQVALLGDVKGLVGAASSANNVNRPVLIMNEVDRLALSMMVGLSGEPLYADDLSAGRLGQLEVISSNHVPSKTVLLVQAGNFISAFDEAEFMISNEATIVMADAGAGAPTHSIDATGAILTAPTGLGDVLVDGGIPVVGGPTGAGAAGHTAINMFQTVSEALRGVQPLAYGLVRPSSVAFIQNVTWA